MERTSVSLDAEQMQALRRLAADEQRSVAALVRRAVDAYLAGQCDPNKAWGERFDALVSRVQQRVPASITPEQIEADITAARAEHRRARRASRAASLRARGR